uniref:ATP synthase F0 subunit 8 n=1 Tax=Sigalphus bicolor TaxID=515846 RepID=A0A0A6ZL99_9HYME|nr:ATP synthase F0 subunit 8 [Sigalphus bicolor]
MPQMSSMNWLILMLYFLLIYYFIMVMVINLMNINFYLIEKFNILKKFWMKWY